MGIKTIAQAKVERSSVDVASAMATLNAAMPQINAYKSCAAQIHAARTRGYGGSFCNVSFVGTQTLADELGKEGAGVVVSQVVPSPSKPARAIARDFVDACKTAGDVLVNFSSMESYLAAKELVEGLRRGSKPNRDGLISGLESLNDHAFGGFQVSFSGSNHVASTVRGAVHAHGRWPRANTARTCQRKQVHLPGFLNFAAAQDVVRAACNILRPTTRSVAHSTPAPALGPGRCQDPSRPPAGSAPPWRGAGGK